MRFDAALFDLDGTLLDTIEDLTASMNAMLEGLGCPPHTVAECKVFVGEGVETLVKRALPEGRRDDQTVAVGVERMLEEYGRRWRNATRPYRGVDEMLTDLRDRGMKLGILSNKPHEFTCLTTQALLAEHAFDLVWGVQEGVPKKPDPAGALRAAAALGVEPAHVLYCGDTSTDMATAVAAGFFPAGALWGFRDAAELVESGARVLLPTPKDLLSLV